MNERKELVNETWAKFWNPDRDLTDNQGHISKIISDLFNEFTHANTKKILENVIARHRSLFIVFRKIYFNYFYTEDDQSEVVEVVDPTDLVTLDVKKDKHFLKIQSEGLDSSKTPCPVCGAKGYLEDNRKKKTTDSRFKNIPDFACSNFRNDNGCGKGWWLNSPDLPPGWTGGLYSTYNDDAKYEFYLWNLEQIALIDEGLIKKEYRSKDRKLITRDIWELKGYKYNESTVESKEDEKYNVQILTLEEKDKLNSLVEKNSELMNTRYSELQTTKDKRKELRSEPSDKPIKKWYIDSGHDMFIKKRKELDLAWNVSCGFCGQPGGGARCDCYE